MVITPTDILRQIDQTLQSKQALLNQASLCDEMVVVLEKMRTQLCGPPSKIALSPETPAATPTASFVGMRLHEAINKALTKPLATREVTALLVNGGYRTAAKNFGNLVYNTMKKAEHAKRYGWTFDRTAQKWVKKEWKGKSISA